MTKRRKNRKTLLKNYNSSVCKKAKEFDSCSDPNLQLKNPQLIQLSEGLKEMKAHNLYVTIEEPLSSIKTEVKIEEEEIIDVDSEIEDSPLNICDKLYNINNSLNKSEEEVCFASEISNSNEPGYFKLDQCNESLISTENTKNVIDTDSNSCTPDPLQLPVEDFYLQSEEHKSFVAHTGGIIIKAEDNSDEFCQVFLHEPHIKNENSCETLDNFGQTSSTFIESDSHSADTELHNVLLENSSKSTYECHLCKEQFNRKSDVPIHIHLHCKERFTTKFHRCPECSESFLDQYSLKKHLNDKHTLKYECQLCHKSYYDRSQFTLHMKVHKSRFEYCSLCGAGFASKIWLSHHLKISHSKQKEAFQKKTLKTISRLCTRKKSFAEEKIITKAIATENITEKDIIINNTSLGNLVSTNLEPNRIIACETQDKKIKETSLRLNKDEIPEKNENSSICYICRKILPNAKALSTHYLQHVGEKSYKCSYCDGAFENTYKLFKHLQLHSGIDIFMCHFCGDKFDKQFNLTVHIHLHCKKISPPNSERNHSEIVENNESDDEIQEIYCKFKKTPVQNIKLVHGSELACYKCQFCEKSYCDPQNLRKHSETHILHRCEFCQKVFSKESDVDVHKAHYHLKNAEICLL